MIVATSGHIDHGKTLLVKVLTGTDTDTLPEEKRRGISIDLGFAYLDMPDGSHIGFVDVPGHERFIRNMLAGVAGIDAALLVVAADDGVMPQTVEHSQILDVLGIRNGIAAVTKVDRVTSDRVLEVSASVRALVAGTSLREIPIVPVSASLGMGISDLKAQLIGLAQRAPRQAATGQHFRFAVDRVFSVRGSGTVVSGTVFAGIVRVGEEVVISPAGVDARVRAIQVRKRAVEEIEVRGRCALNLTGQDLERASLSRGAWIVNTALHRPTSRIDVQLRLLPGAPTLKHLTQVHLHLGASTASARILTRSGVAIPAGSNHVAQLALDRPIGTLNGDRFVLRNPSTNQTLGGGSVLDPFAPARHRYTAARQSELTSLHALTPGEALESFGTSHPNGFDITDFEVSFNLTPEAASALYKACGLELFIWEGRRYAMPEGRKESVRELILTRVSEVHERNPRAIGLSLSELPKVLSGQAPSWVLDALARDLANDGMLELLGAQLRKPGYDSTANPLDEDLWRQVLPELQRDMPLPPRIKDISVKLGIPEPDIADLLHRKSLRGEPIKVMNNRFLLRSTVFRLADIAQTTASSLGTFTAAQFRDRCGANRKSSIKVLEYFDRVGYTQRIGDARRVLRPIAEVLGNDRKTSPFAPAEASEAQA